MLTSNKLDPPALSTVKPNFKEFFLRYIWLETFTISLATCCSGENSIFFVSVLFRGTKWIGKRGGQGRGEGETDGRTAPPFRRGNVLGHFSPSLNFTNELGRTAESVLAKSCTGQSTFFKPFHTCTDPSLYALPWNIQQVLIIDLQCKWLVKTRPMHGDLCMAFTLRYLVGVKCCLKASVAFTPMQHLVLLLAATPTLSLCENISRLLGFSTEWPGKQRSLWGK